MAGKKQTKPTDLRNRHMECTVYFNNWYLGNERRESILGKRQRMCGQREKDKKKRSGNAIRNY